MLRHRTSADRTGGLALGTILVLGLALLLAACGGGASSGQSTGPISAEWLTVPAEGDVVKIPVSTIEKHRNIHFTVPALGKIAAFMAYVGPDGINVRANVCPPCRSKGFSLSGKVLVCDTCATTFDAATGNGINGACVDFPKASVAYEVADGQVTMQKVDLAMAYQNTMVPGLP